MKERTDGSLFHVALAVELALLPLSLALGRLLGVWAPATLGLNLRGAVLGVLATVPMLPLLLMGAHSAARPFRRVREHVEAIVDLVPRGREWSGSALLGTAAGVGEEFLFRGVLQAWLATLAGSTGSWLLISLLFGVLHGVTLTYAVIATLLGLYLGWLWMASGNLLVPIVAHGLYDFVGLVYFLHLRRKGDGDPAGLMMSEE